MQRRFTKRLAGFRELKCSKRLAPLGADSLELRRLSLELIFVYTTMFCLNDVNHYERVSDRHDLRQDRPTKCTSKTESPVRNSRTITFLLTMVNRQTKNTGQHAAIVTDKPKTLGSAHRRE